MANHTYSKGLLYKKTLNSSGEVTGSVPLLLKTLGSLVIMSDGTDAETAISAAISNMVTPDETTIVTGQDGITISVKKSTSAEIDEILGDVPTSHTWEGYYTKSETEALIDAVDDKISQSGIETALGYTPIPTTAKGSNNGVAELDATGKVPASQLPSYVDDVIESATYAALPATGEAGKIYVTLNDDKTYRWSGSAYVEISASLALGETSSTAYRGDRGKTAYDHSQAAHARTDATNAAIVSGKLNINGTATNIGDFKAVSTAASQGLTDTEKTNALANIGAVPNSDFVVAENNILYNLNMGVKNLLTIKPTFTINGLTSVQQPDGYTVKITGTPTGGKSIQWSEIIKITESGTYKVKLTLSGTMASCYLYDMTTQTLVHEYYSSNTYEETLTANHEYAMYTYSQSAIDATISAMLCTAAAYAQSTDFQPPALPNYDLTRLQSEDRAELAELVDSGAKQLVDLSNTGTGTHNNVTFTNLGGNKYKVNGTPSAVDTHLDIMGTWSTVPSFISNNVGKTIVFATNQEHVYYGIIPIVGGSALEYVSGNKTNPVAYTIPSNLSGALLRIYVDTNHTYDNVTAELLVCTKAAFGVSSKFVPYRPNWDLVCQNIKDVNTVLEAVL